MNRRAALASLFVSVGAAVFAFRMADSYIDRLPNHAGYFLVPVEDAVRAPHARPRHTVLIVVDGLSQATAEKFASRKRLAAFGQCRTMKGGPLTISRPMYSVLSTGLEEARSGCRNNFEETRPLVADSIWQSARRSGLDVTAASGVSWWQVLFPNGFDRYDLVGFDGDPFARAELRDLTLIHPLYVDEVGHEYGAASPEYERAAHRADEAVLALLDRLDLNLDLVVLTADHGHTSHGGHGGPDPEIADVMTCFSGPGVVRRGDEATMDARSLAPTLALFLGVPFPRHMRAGDDDLDVPFEIADATSSAFAPDYLADRKAAIAHFRDENRAALARWLGSLSAPTWTSLYAREAGWQSARLAVGALAMALLFLFIARRRTLTLRACIELALWMAIIVSTTLAAYLAVRHSLDFSSINEKPEFLRAALGLSFAVGALGLIAHRLLLRDPLRLLRDQLTLIALLTFSIAVHPLVYGWPLGFPLPDAHMIFFPFLAPMVLLVHALFAAALSVRWLITAWR